MGPLTQVGHYRLLKRGEPKCHKNAVIGGDGIGPEVTSVALEVMRAAGADLGDH